MLNLPITLCLKDFVTEMKFQMFTKTNLEEAFRKNAYLLRSSGLPHPLIKSFVRRSLRYRISNLLTPISSKQTSIKQKFK